MAGAEPARPASGETPADLRRQALRDLLPEALRDGELDVEALREALGLPLAAGPERFGLTWPGRREAIASIRNPPAGTLRPRQDLSVGFDQSTNCIIEGDNLEVLRLLQKSYHRGVKMIYIDPPYNTGNDFVYDDDFSDSLGDYLRFTGQVTGGGAALTTNREGSGRFHSRWLSMMLPRLMLARNLLASDGAIFVSIDDNESPRLRCLMDEVFGEENFVATLVWEGGKKGDAKLISESHEYIVVYARDRSELRKKDIRWRLRKPGLDSVLGKYRELRASLGDDHGEIRKRMMAWYRALPEGSPSKAHKHYNWSDDRGLYFPDNFAGPDDGRASRPRFEILHPITRQPCAIPSTGWRWDQARVAGALAENPPRIHFGPDHTTIPCRKSYLEEVSDEPMASVFYRDRRAATLELENLIGRGLFDFPKDVSVLTDLVSLLTSGDDLVLDFFAGSGSTAQAVVEANARDRGRRRYLLVQLPQPIENPTAREQGMRTIADVCRARARAVGARIEADEPGANPGFKAFVLDSSNFRPWQPQANAAALAEQLRLHADHVLAGRSGDDLLFEILLREGWPLTTPIASERIGHTTFHRVADGQLLICLAVPLDAAAVRATIASGTRPRRLICLDQAFAARDADKSNLVLELREREIEFTAL